MNLEGLAYAVQNVHCSVAGFPGAASSFTVGQLVFEIQVYVLKFIFLLMQGIQIFFNNCVGIFAFTKGLGDRVRTPGFFASCSKDTVLVESA